MKVRMSCALSPQRLPNDPSHESNYIHTFYNETKNLPVPSTVSLLQLKTTIHLLSNVWGATLLTYLL